MTRDKKEKCPECGGVLIEERQTAPSRRRAWLWCLDCGQTVGRAEKVTVKQESLPLEG